MGDKELRIGAMELHRLSLGCHHCKSEAVFEAGAPQGPGVVACPNCSAPLPHAGEMVRMYRDFFRACDTVKDKMTVSLLVRLDD